MWDLIVSVPDHCSSFYFGQSFHFDRIEIILVSRQSLKDFDGYQPFRTHCKN